MEKSKPGRNKRNKSQRDYDIALIILLLKSCSTHEEVTRALNKERKGKYTLSRQQVSNDIGDAIQELVERNTNNTLQARVLAAERQLGIASEAHGQYLRSCKLDQIKRVSESRKGGEEGETKTTRTETTTRLGDPRYLSVMISALAEHSRLLGLYTQPAKDDAFVPNTQINQFAVNVTISSDGKPPAHDPLDDIIKINDRPDTASGEAKTAHGAADSGIKFQASSSAT